MRYNKIRKMDISNGPGIRVSIFLQGCTFNCKNCFNPETHDFNSGKGELDEEKMNFILDLCDKEYIRGLSILGGEPMHPKNIDGVTKLAKMFKERFPNKDLWAWSGYLYDDLKDKEIMEYLDVLVDGRYMDELHDFRLEWRGSSNQRVIDIKKTKKQGKIVIWKESK